jgi:hypothetical protein
MVPFAGAAATGCGLAVVGSFTMVSGTDEHAARELIATNTLIDAMAARFIMAVTGYDARTVKAFLQLRQAL